MTGNDLLTHAGTTQSVNDWALDYGIYPAVILDRLARGWCAERAITAPMITVPNQRLDQRHMPAARKSAPSLKRRACAVRWGKRYAHEGRVLTVAEWSKVTGVKAATIHHRLRQGWPMHMVLRSELRIRRPGVVANFPQPVGTGGGPIAQDIPEIEFSQ